MACTSTEPAERYSFAAGPAMLPAAVLAQIAADLPNWRATGFSLLEQPFTGAPFKALMHDTEQLLRRLLAIPRGYRVLFLQGGASAQFGLVPLNLLHPGQGADYLDSGHWARKAIAEARRHCQVRVVASGAASGYTALPDPHDWPLDPAAGYCHLTSNETGHGLQWHAMPAVPVPLVADVTSDLCTRPLPIERFGLLYASAQKNLGVAGLCLLIVREDLLQDSPPGLPAAFSYAVQAEQQSRFNTPPTFALYVAHLMLRWIEAQGGLTVMAANARERSRRLYRYIDASGFYHCPQRRADRSTVNVCFQLRDARQVEAFITEAAQAGLHHLAGHAAVGGLRASLYNAMPMAGVERLLAFMHAFECRHG
ncbi:3-phosphoserine/phosphohydroxythreonine transaminase [Pseudomonas sp.]|uniref:3-phosphoserine/phosphohydroxythreonine transaminase n=1 Tax=Pseudomonas sp. TaxID=306 RepID=UPI0028AB90C3|nr:3-phosphoserine/phosphohydroxythreonine transaminase [Pseudomonas sp.]